MGRHERLVQETFVSLADTLASDYGIGDFLYLLVERCNEVLDITTGGVMLESPSGALELAAATTDEMKVLEELEMEHREGPCLEAYRDVKQVTAEDLREHVDRWPTVAPYAIDMGLVAVFGFPMQLRGDCIGALNLYRDQVGPFDQADIDLAQAFAHVAAIGIMQERRLSDAELRSGQLQHALDSRVIIEQAKGVLAERLDISPNSAFERLRQYARSHNATVRSVCEDVLAQKIAVD